MLMYIQTGQSFEIEYNLFMSTEKRLIRKYRTNQGARNSMSKYRITERSSFTSRKKKT